MGELGTSPQKGIYIFQGKFGRWWWVGAACAVRAMGLPAFPTLGLTRIDQFPVEQVGGVEEHRVRLKRVASQGGL